MMWVRNTVQEEKAMMKNRFPVILIPAAFIITAFAGMSLTADAAGAYTPVSGGNTALDKYLVMDEGANVPDVSFEYTISSGQAQSFNEQDKTIEVIAGPSPEKIVFTGNSVSDEIKTDCKFEIGFAPGDSTKTQEQKDASDYVKNLDPGEKYAKKTVDIDLNGISFDEPGIYRYIITETQGSAQGITYDAENTRVLDVYVTDNTDESGVSGLKISGYVLHSSPSAVTIDEIQYGSDGQVISASSSQEPGTEGSDYKSQGFTNEYTSYDLTFSKDVSGNQASRDKYFRFDLEITGAVPGTVYAVSYADDNNEHTTDGSADVSISKAPNSATTVIDNDIIQPSEITADADGKVRQSFYLQHGQYITVRGLSQGTKYSIKDVKEDYAASYTTNDMDDTTVSKLDFASDRSGIDQDVSVGFVNTRNGIIPTGVILTVAPFAVIGAALIAGIVFLIVKNRKRRSEEE